jgi:toxin secretion/phage lysis holin
MDMQYIVDNFQFVSLFWAFVLPLSLEAIDFLTGYVNACIRHERSSAKMREGGGRKFGEAMCLLVAQLFTWGMHLPTFFVYGVSLWICFMEFVSIMENVKLLGVAIPGKFEKKVNDMKDELYDDSVLDIEHSASEDEDSKEE